jgi:hypothetical protein
MIHCICSQLGINVQWNLALTIQFKLRQLFSALDNHATLPAESLSH